MRTKPHQIKKIESPLLFHLYINAPLDKFYRFRSLPLSTVIDINPLRSILAFSPSYKLKTNTICSTGTKINEGLHAETGGLIEAFFGKCPLRLHY